MRAVRFFASLLLSLSLLALISCEQVAPPAAYGPTPDENQLAWQKMEYYMFVHFGPNTFTDVEWGDGKEDPGVFNPTELDCRQWAETARAAGMKGIILTAKHHDGFCLWPSAYSTHTVRESPWRDGGGDLLRELSEACREYGLKLGVYLSPWDRNHPSYGTPDYNGVFANTLDEVLSNYGEIFEQWFDGATGHGARRQEYDWGLFHETVYRNQPQAIIFSDVGPGCRWMGNERGIAGKTNWSRLDTDGFTPGMGAPPGDTLSRGNILGKRWIPAETDVSIRPGWFYSPATDDRVKSLEQLVDIYFTSVGRNSNLLLNVPPDRRGRIHPNDSVRLMEFRHAIEQMFSENLLRDAAVEASEVRGNSKKYGAANLLDGDYDSYWTTNDDTCGATIEITLPREETFNCLMLQEYIPLGQRVAGFSIEALVEGRWLQVAQATTIGYKRLLRFEPVKAQKLRIDIRESLACPVLNGAALYLIPEKPATPEIRRGRDGLVSISCATGGTRIYYTLDAGEPTGRSTLYEGKFAMPEAGTVKAVAVLEQTGQTSGIAAEEFDISARGWTILSPRHERAEELLDGDGARHIAVGRGEEVVIDLGKELAVKGFYYTPAPDREENNVAKYNFYVSGDGKNWEKIKSAAAFDNIANNPVRQAVRFDGAVGARYVKFEAVETTFGGEKYCVAEFGIITK